MAKHSKKITMGELIGPISGLSGVLVWTKMGSLSYGIDTCFFLIAVYVLIWFVKRGKKNERLKKSGMLDIDKMDGFKFESYLGILYRSIGYKSEVTRAVGDYGADLILTKKGKGEKSERIVVQAKRYKKNVGIKAVQEVIAAKNYYKANSSWVVTNSYFTEQAIKLANANGVKLINRDQLQDFIIKANLNKTPKQILLKTEQDSDLEQELILEPAASEHNRCPRCGSELIVRNGKHGKFYGCSDFPKCRFTMDFVEEESPAAN